MSKELREVMQHMHMAVCKTPSYCFIIPAYEEYSDYRGHLDTETEAHDVATEIIQDSCGLSGVTVKFFTGEWTDGGDVVNVVEYEYLVK